MSKNKYYVVDWGKGEKPDLFDNWSECSRAITGRSYRSQHGYPNLSDAQAAITAIGRESAPKPSQSTLKKTRSGGVMSNEKQDKPTGTFRETLKTFYRNHPAAYEVHSDGGARPNPGKGGFGYVVVDDQKRIIEEGYGSDKNTTNNRMELMGAIRGFESVPEGAQVLFMTDSKLVYTGLGQNLDKDPRPRFIKWEERSWKNVMNLDLVQTLYRLGKQHGVDCIPRPLNAKGTDYARVGHLDHGAKKISGKWEFPYNKICDKLAEYGEMDAAEGIEHQVRLISNGKILDERALFVGERDEYGAGTVVDRDGQEVAVN